MSKSLMLGLVAVFVATLCLPVTAAWQGPPPPPPSATAMPNQGGGPGSGPTAARGRPGGPAAVPEPPPPSPAAVAHAAQVLAAARQAMGGDKLAAVKTIDVTGRSRRVRGNNLQPIEFEIFIELPDKYLRKDEFPAEESDPTSSGFNGADLIQQPAPPAPPARAGGAGPTAAQLEAQHAARVMTVKQDFVRLALGLFPDSPAAYPLTFAYAAQAEAPQGTADVLDVRGAGNFSLKYFLNSVTHLPVMLSWQLPPTSVIVTVPGQPPPNTVAPGAVVVVGPPPPASSASAEDKARYTADVQALRQKTQAIPVEHRLYFAEYQDVDGIQWPFRLRRAIGPDTTEETTFDRFKINGRIDPKRFRVAK